MMIRKGVILRLASQIQQYSISNILSPSILLLQFLMKINLMMPVPVLLPATVKTLLSSTSKYKTPTFLARQMESELAEWYQGQAVFFDKTHPDHATVISVSLVKLYAILYAIVRYGKFIRKVWPIPCIRHGYVMMREYFRKVRQRFGCQSANTYLLPRSNRHEWLIRREYYVKLWVWFVDFFIRIVCPTRRDARFR